MSLSEVQERVLQLESAIKRLDIVKKHLNRNASDVKAEIHASVSRNLECLRNREVTLLRQVDQVLRVKEETLQHQQARLNQTLGVLRTGLSMMLEHTASERQLTETLEKLNRIELSPEETPYISFRADHVKLRESILHYGRVDASGLPPLIAFDDPGNPSASLPRHVEEYHDVDHHVFYKTLEELKRTKSAAGVRSINVVIPKLSTHVEDWLQKKAPVIKTKTEAPKAPDRRQLAIRPSLLNKSGEVPAIGLSDTPTPGSSCSINSWLSLIKQHADLEEEHDFEIVDNSCLQKAETKSPATNSEALPASLQGIKKDLQSWLISCSGSAAKFSSTFFNHVPSDSKIWLSQASQQLTSLGDVKHQNIFKDVSSEPTAWLGSQADCKPRLASHGGGDCCNITSPDQEDCLHGQNKAFPAEIEDAGGKTDRADHTDSSGCSSSCSNEVEGKWLLCRVASAPAFQLEDICQTSDVCSIASKCGSQSDCLRPCFKDKSPVKSVVGPTHTFKHLPVTSNEWPSSTSPQIVIKCPPTTAAEKGDPDLFSHIPSASNAMWLMKPSTQSSFEPGRNQYQPDKLKIDKQEASLRQQKKGCINVLESSSSTCAKSVSVSTDFCITDWLMVSNKGKDGCPEELGQNKDESEG